MYEAADKAPAYWSSALKDEDRLDLLRKVFEFVYNGICFARRIMVVLPLSRELDFAKEKLKHSAAPLALLFSTNGVFRLD